MGQQSNKVIKRRRRRAYLERKKDRVKVARAGARLQLGAPYGYFHQVGTRNMVARRIFPQFGPPASWREILRASAREERRKILARSR